MWLLEVHWWVYFLVAIVVFLALLLLNFVVKKINEARLEERFNRLRTKANNEFTQVQTPLIEIESKKRIQLNTAKVPPVSTEKIALVLDNNIKFRDKNEVNEKSICNASNVSDALNKNASPSHASAHSTSRNARPSKSDNLSFNFTRNIRSSKIGTFPSKLNDIPLKSRPCLTETNCPSKSNDLTSKVKALLSKTNAHSHKSNDLVPKRNARSSKNNAHTSKLNDLPSKTNVSSSEGNATASKSNNLPTKSNIDATKIKDSKLTPLKCVDKSKVSNKVIIKDSESSYRILNSIVDRMVTKLNESKSTPNMKKLLDVQSKEELKEWMSDLIKYNPGEEYIRQKKMVSLKKSLSNPEDELDE